MARVGVSATLELAQEQLASQGLTSTFIMAVTSEGAFCTSTDDEVDDIILVLAQAIQARRHGELIPND